MARRALIVASEICLAVAALWVWQVASTAAQEEKQPTIYVKHLEPPLRYPPLARQTRLSGTIVMKLTIGKDGTVLAVRVLARRLKNSGV